MIEDAYYAFSVSRSIAEGDGFTIDGERPTNGVQPLICLIYAPVFLVFDGDQVTPLRGVLAIEILIALLGAFLFGRFLQRIRTPQIPLPDELIFWAGAASWLVNYSLMTHLLNGLETGLTLLILLLILIYWSGLQISWREGRGRSREAVVLGFLIGIAVLARIDAVLVGTSFAITYVVLRMHYAGRIAMRDLGLLAIVAIVALGISSPWWVYNVTEFGHLLPVSGQSQADLESDLWSVVSSTISTVSDALVPGLHTPTGWGIGGVYVSGLILPLLLVCAAILSRRVRESLRTLRVTWKRDWNGSGLLLLCVVTGMMVVAYTFFFAAPHFQPRYLISTQVLGNLLVITPALTLLHMYGSKSTLVTRGVRFSALLLFLLSLIMMSRHYLGYYSNIMLEPVEWLRENTSEGDRIGMFQSGTTGYFFPRRVVNLDGKVNPDALRTYRQGKLGEYVDEMEFTYLIDWPLYTDRIFEDSPSDLVYRPIDTLELSQVVVWKRFDRETSTPGSP